MANSVDDLIGSTEPVFDPNKSYGTPTNILDGVLKTESGGKQYAINPKTKAMGPYQFMPETIADMHSKGIKFDPLDPVQARNAADYYLQQLAAKNGGDYNKALAQFGGFQKKDPTAYVASVNSGGPTKTTKSNQCSSSGTTKSGSSGRYRTACGSNKAKWDNITKRSTRLVYAR